MFIPRLRGQRMPSFCALGGVFASDLDRCGAAISTLMTKELKKGNYRWLGIY